MDLSINSSSNDNIKHNPPTGVAEWEYAGLGYVSWIDQPNVNVVCNTGDEPLHSNKKNTDDISVECNVNTPLLKKNSKPQKDHKLGVIASTALCGNDITSSVLYTAGQVAQYADIFSPLCLILVLVVLHLFKKIYIELVTALPLNGGTYTSILNTTSKKLAALAATLSFLSYMATVVVSATTAIGYLQSRLWTNLSEDDLAIPVILLLAFFALLMILGIRESSMVAVSIFILHMTTVIMLIVCCCLACYYDGGAMFYHNFSTWRSRMGNVPKSLVFGFSSAMLGISGFETSANFVEEQKPGVFAKTLRNMWIAVALINPLVSLLSFGVLGMDKLPSDVDGWKSTAGSDTLLSDMSRAVSKYVGGNWISYLVSIDAVLVLSGAVLTGYVGVTGLMKRMASDRVLPAFFLQENPWTHTNHWIISFFFFVCTSLYLISRGDVIFMSSIYCLSFLSVMGLFSIGDLILKHKRSSLHRDTKAHPVNVLLALIFVIIAIVGNISKPSKSAQVKERLSMISVFLIFFVCFFAVVISMFYRTIVLKHILHDIDKRKRSSKFALWLQEKLRKWLYNIVREPVVFFSKDLDLATMNKTVLYVLTNEQTQLLKIVHVYKDREDVPSNFVTQLAVLDALYPKIRIDVHLIQGTFNPEMLHRISAELNVPTNRMFMQCPSESFPWKLPDLGGIRIITHRTGRLHPHVAKALGHTVVDGSHETPVNRVIVRSDHSTEEQYMVRGSQRDVSSLDDDCDASIF